MNDTPKPHEPTPEFRAELEREITRTFLRESQFAPPAAPFRVGRLGKVAALAACMVLMLAVGLVWGVGTGFAASQVQDGTERVEPLPLAMVRTTPVRKALAALSCNNPVAATGTPITEMSPQAPSIIDLPPASVRSADRFVALMGIKQVAGGKVLVNDGGSRQLKLLDSTLANGTIVSDSAPGRETSYGPMPVPLLRHLGDSSFVPNFFTKSLLILDGSGNVVRDATPPNPLDFTGLMAGSAATDPRGRIVYRAPVGNSAPRAFRVTTISHPDSVPILRVDFQRRAVDTVARIGARTGDTRVVDRTDPQDARMTVTINPVQVMDDWALLSDGTIAIVRAKDYHVDWVSPTGRLTSSPKMPFDWKRITDDEKQRLIDSARVSRETAMRGTEGMPTTLAFPPLSQIADQYPPIRRGAVLSDLDGNIWILPTSSAQSRNGELVYDVTNMRGQFRRVRLPLGRTVAGFGQGGVVYLQSGDKATGFHLERTRLPAGAR